MTQYLLTCDCGQTVSVGRSQAGLEVPCTCGRNVRVPTFRDLAGYAVDPAAPVRANSTWGPRQACIFLGILIALIGMVLAAWRGGELIPPDPAEGMQIQVFKDAVESLPPEQLIAEWRVEQQGLDPTQGTIWEQYQAERAFRQIWFIVTCAIAVAGAALVLIAFLWPGPRRAA
jgi:hypothetical protein